MTDAPRLNPAQMEAVQHLAGPCLVLAGAGSGKTRVIAHKIARLLAAGHEPGQIAAITFTNKAAAEMRERARSLVGPRAAGKLVVCTFHALGVRLLRADGERLGLKPQFSILDADDALALLRDAGGTTDAALARRWQWRISRWKNDGLRAAQVEPADDDEGVAQRVMARYEERLAAYQAVDFDDLVALPCTLLRGHAEVRERWRDTLRYLLVDEVQDTNRMQYALLALLTGTRGAFTAVGDDDQSIYGWRGATVENLKQLTIDWPKLKVIALEQNYRSTGRILRAANAVIAHNPKLYPKNLWSDLGDGEPVRVLECDGEEHEAERAAAWIRSQRDATGPAATAAGGGACTWRDFAVLYRANFQAKAFEKALRRAQIPYKVSGGQSFFERAEIRDLCAWLRLIVNNDDDPAFLRAVAVPKRGVGHQSLAALGEFAGRAKASLFEALFSERLHDVLNPRAVAALHDFGRCVNAFEHRARQTTGREGAQALLLDWLKEIGYEQHLHDHEDREALADARWSNVLDFVDWIARRCGGELDVDGAMASESSRRSVHDVAQTISILASIAERGDDNDVVTLSTLHAAKGLEWPHVFLAGVVEGLLPLRSEDDEMTADRLHEERRLMYVGITRAQRTLSVSTLRRRKRGRETVQGVASRFIAEMKLDDEAAKVDPRAKLKALREAAKQRAASAAATPES